MNFSIIFARDVKLGGFGGFDNKMPWNIKEDLQYFYKITNQVKNSILIMGRNTYESMEEMRKKENDNDNEKKNNRISIVVTTSKNNNDNVYTADSLISDLFSFEITRKK